MAEGPLSSCAIAWSCPFRIGIRTRAIPIDRVRWNRATTFQKILPLDRQTRRNRILTSFRYPPENIAFSTALPESNAVPAEPVFGSSHSHRVWKMMDALIDAQPEWADVEVFEQAREKRKLV
jgi:hypothetical protein